MIGRKKETISIEIRRSRRRTLGLEILPDGTVIVRAPFGVSEKRIRQFVEEKKEWILQKSTLIREKEKNRIETGAPPFEELSAKERKAVREKILSRVSYFCTVMDVTVNRISIRSQKTRWGSCSSKGNVNFNYLLAYLPEELLDYVVVHELAHRRYMNHSADFWAEVSKNCPDFRERRRQLKKYSLQ